MLPVLQLGPLAIQTPGLILLLGLWLGLTLVERYASRHGVPAERLYNLALTALVAGLLGARLAYALRYFSAFAASPFSLFSLNPGLLDLPAGIGLGLIAAWVYGQRKGLALWPTLDALTPGLALFGVALGLSHLASGAAFGSPTALPWGIELWGARRHPAQVYETLLAALVLWAVWPGKGLLCAPRPGARFLLFTACSAGARLFLEAFRGDSLLIAGGFRAAQVGAWVVLALSLWGFYRLSFAGQAPKDGYTTEA